MKWMLAVIAATLLAGAAVHSQSRYPAYPTADPVLRALLLRSSRGIKAAAAPDPSLPSAITVDYPTEGSVFPPDMSAPLFQWRDANLSVTSWQLDIAFEGRAEQMKLRSAGEKLQIGDIDTTLIGFVPPELTPEQAAAHTWRPDQKTWARIKKYSEGHRATLTITGLSKADNNKPVSRGQVTIETSKDPVSAPIFFRDVPLLPPAPDQGERGVIRPLPESVLPMIKWELRYISESRSRVVMTGLPTCANCHSISSDGKTLGIDVDGPQNDKGLYGLVPIRKNSSITNDYVIHWSAFTEKGTQKRFGFMSQLSPDGKFVITSVSPSGSHGPRIVDRLYNGFYPNYGFGQVFYPTRGVLAWYSKDEGKLATLPGADDPEYVHTGAFWSPDGKYLVFSRARARDPYPLGQKKSEYANDPNETQIQYDLCRIPFNGGKGGKAEPLLGASDNGWSNNFPKISPNGKWIVFVQNKNGLLMRPDSHLYMIPAEGGVARRMNANQKVMNSWHSFSPNGRWLVFSSKSPSLYTHLYLTHIDENGNDSPAVMIENATAANRAANIPEFMNIAPGGLERIDAPVTDFYHQFDVAIQLANKKQFDQAVPAWNKAVALAPDDARARNNLGVALVELGRTNEAVMEYRKSLELNNDSAQTHNNLGSALAEKGSMAEAVSQFENALALDPDNAAAHINLGNALAARGERKAEALQQLRKGVELQPQAADGQNGLGVALARAGLLDEAISHLERAVALAPEAAGYHSNLGRVLAAHSEYQKAIPQYEQASRLSAQQDPAILEMLAAMYSETGRYSDAAITAHSALTLATRQGHVALADTLKKSIARYESMGSRPQPVAVP